MTKLSSHHDALFKKFLGDINVARDFLDIHLPAPLRQRCDLSTLAMESSTFIKNSLRSRYSDMLYSVQTTGGPGYIYTVIEHQSRPEKKMPFRMLGYCLEAMQQHLDQGHKQLPVVIPLLFYHGRTSPYPYTTYWLDCFADPELAKSVYTQPFPLIDITTTPDDEIMAHRRVAVLELIQKHIRTRDMLELSNDIALLISQWALPHAQFRSLMFYIAECGTTSDVEQFLHNIDQKITDYREDAMKIAEVLRQQGMQKGIQEGILIGEQRGEQIGEQRGEQRGEQKGEKNAAVKIAHQLITRGIERSIVKHSTGLTEQELDSLMDLQ